MRVIEADVEKAIQHLNLTTVSGYPTHPPSLWAIRKTPNECLAVHRYVSKSDPLSASITPLETTTTVGRAADIRRWSRCRGLHTPRGASATLDRPTGHHPGPREDRSDSEPTSLQPLNREFAQVVQWSGPY